MFNRLKSKVCGSQKKEKSMHNLLIACLYSSLKKNDVSFTLSELSSCTHFEPKRVLQYYNLYLHSPSIVLLPSKLVFRFCSRLSLIIKDAVNIEELTREWELRNNYACKPETVVMGIICHYFLKNGLTRLDGTVFKSIAEICKKCYVNCTTIRRFLKKFSLLPK